MPNKFKANRMTLWKRGRIYGDAKKYFTARMNQRPPASCPVKRAAIWPGDMKTRSTKVPTIWKSFSQPEYAGVALDNTSPTRQALSAIPCVSATMMTLVQVVSFSGDNILHASLLLKPWKRTVIIDLARTCKIANEERHGMFRSPATARPPIRSTRRGRERFLVWILSYCYNFVIL